MRRKRRSSGQWAELIRQFEQSGQSHSEFARHHRLNLGTFRKQLYKFRQTTTQQPVHFVEVQADPVSAAPAMEIAVGRSVVLKLSDEVTPQNVVDIVVGLVSAGC